MLGDLERCRKGKLDNMDPKCMITVKGDEAILSRIMHIVTLAVCDSSTYYTLDHTNLRHQFVQPPNFSRFLCQVDTRQKPKIDNLSFVFLLLTVALRVPPTYHTLKVHTPASDG